MHRSRTPLLALALAVTPSSAYACSFIERLDIWYFYFQTVCMTSLLLIVWVGGKKVWMGQLILALLSGISVYVYQTYAEYFVRGPRVSSTGELLLHECGEIHASLPGLFSVWVLLTFGVYSVWKPMRHSLTPAIPYRRIALITLWGSSIAVGGMYAASLVLLVASFITH